MRTNKIIFHFGCLMMAITIPHLSSCGGAEDKINEETCTIYTRQDSACYCANNPGSTPCTPVLSGDQPCSSTPVACHGQLRVEGNQIVDSTGRAVQLHGMSFFWSQWIGKYYTPQTVKWLKDDWRCTIVRAAMAVEADGYLANPEQEKQKVKTVVDAAIAEGIYVIIDWHDHHAENHTAAAKEFFAEMAQLYGNYPNVIYEPYNEPEGNKSWTGVVKPYHTEVISAIRAHDPDNIIVCGTPNWSQDVDVATSSPLSGSNLAYTLHFYADTHKQSLRDKAVTAMNRGYALMVTEYGTCDASGGGPVNQAETTTWWNFMNEHNLSSCNWSVADKIETAAILKPGASATGGWATSQLTPSGTFVRTFLRSKNPAQ